MTYPNTKGFAYSFGRAELSVGRRIFTKIRNVNADQPTTSEAVMGTSPYPLDETEGEMGLGTGSFEFTDEGERAAFIEELGDGWRSRRWALKWINTAAGKPPIIHECFGCRCTSEPLAHAQGPTALGGVVNFNFIEKRYNGKRPHDA